jgi:hypothetical protein
MNYTADNPAHMGTTVFIDGVEVYDCVEADTSEGYVVYAKRDKNRCFYADGNHFVLGCCFGVVTAKTPKATTD